VGEATGKQMGGWVGGASVRLPRLRCVEPALLCQILRVGVQAVVCLAVLFRGRARRPLNPRPPAPSCRRVSTSDGNQGNYVLSLLHDNEPLHFQIKSQGGVRAAVAIAAPRAVARSRALRRRYPCTRKALPAEVTHLLAWV